MVSKNYIMNMGIKYNVDQNSVSQVKKSIAEIQDDLARVMHVAQTPGNQFNQQLQQAGQTAKFLSEMLDKSFNIKLDTIDLSIFNNLLKQSNMSVQQIATNLSYAGNVGVTAFNNLALHTLEVQNQIKRTSTLVEKMALTFANTIRFGISSSIFNSFTGAISRAYGYVQKLDKSLNDIRIVSDESSYNMEKFAKYANQAAQNLGASTLDYTNAALIYYQQGLPEQQVKERTDITVKMANVLGTSASEVSDYMTAIWNNFAKGGENLEYFADVLTSLGAKTASSAEEISTGLEKFAAISSTVGLSYEYAAAALTTVTDRTRQSAEVVGTAFKTLFARIQDLELGKTLDDGTTLGKYSEALLAVGINIKDQNGQLKNMDTILEEMGAKWKTLSADQQVALAQNVAGVRQYTQLMSLMNEWDFFQQNLKWAADATGELNKQQAIFAQSLEGHLNSLEASKEAIYNNLFNTKEIIPLVDLLKNITDSVNNLISSFGGGAKSLLGFGAIFSSVFNKTIVNALDRWKNNHKIMLENLADLQTKAEMINSSGFLQINEQEKATPTDYAIAENAKTQYEYAAKIYDIHGQLESTEYNELTLLQKQIGEMEAQAVLIEKTAEQEVIKSLGEEKYQEYLTELTQSQKDLDSYWTDRLDNQQNAIDNLKTEEDYLQAIIEDSRTQLIEGQELIDVQETLENIMEQGIALNQDELDLLEHAKDFNSATTKEKQNILNIVNRIIKAQEKSLEVDKKANKAVIEQEKARQEAADIRKKNEETNKKEFNQKISVAQDKGDLNKEVTGITTAVSSLAMAYSSISSITDTILNDSLSIGEKLIQIISTLSFSLPILIGNIHKIGSAFGITTGFLDGFVARVRLKHMLQEKGIVLSELENGLQDKDIALKASGIVLNEAGTASLAAKNAEKTQEIILNGKNIVVTEAEAAAYHQAMIASNALNASLWANPLILLGGAAVLGLLAAFIGTSIYASKQAEKLAEAQKKLNDETIQNQNKIQQEKQSQIDIFNAYTKTLDSYKKGIATKEELSKVTNDLIPLLGEEAVRVAQLTGNYDDLTESVINARKTALNDKKQSIITEQEAEKANIQAFINKNGSQGTYDGQDYKTLHLEGYSFKKDLYGTKNQEEYKALEYIMQNITAPVSHSSGLGGWEYGNIYFDPNDMESILQLYDDLTKVYNDFYNGNSTLTQKEVSNSGVINNYLSKYIDELKPLVEEYRATNKELQDIEAEIAVFDIDFKGVETYKDYKTKENQLVEKLRDSGLYDGLSDEELQQKVRTLAESQNSNLNSIITKGYTIEAVVDLIPGEVKFDNLLGNEDWSIADMYGGKENFSETLTNALGDLDITELNALLNSGESLDLMLSKMAELEYSTGIESTTLEEKLHSLAGTFLDTKIPAAAVNEELAKLLQTLGVSESEFQEYVRQLQKMNPELRKNEKEAKEIALANIRMNKGLKDLADNFDDLKKPLKENKTGTQEFAQALDKMQGIMGNILDIDGEDLSDSFYTSAKNLKLMEQAANGSTEAVEKLRQEAGNDIIAQVYAKANTDEARNAIKSIDEMIDGINTKNLTPGASIDLSQFNTDSEKFQDKLNEMIAASGMTAEQVNAYLASMGYEAQIEQGEPVKQTVHHSGIYVREDPNSPDGLKKIPWSFDTEEWVSVPKITSLNYKGPAAKTVNLNNGKGKTGSSGNKSKNLEMTKTDVDRYHPVNTQIEKIDKALQKLQKTQDKLTGKSKFDNLVQQWQLINNQINNYDKKLQIAKQEQAELRKTLSQQGVTFNADGTISNYEQAIRNQEAKLNNLKKQYNSLSEKQKEKWDEAGTVDKAEKEFEEFLDNIDRLDELTVSFIPEIEDSKLEALAQQVELKIQQFNLELDLKIKTAEAERDWNEFKKKVIDKLNDEDILGNAKATAADLRTYLQNDGSGQAQVQIAKLAELLSNPNIFGNDPVKYREQLQELYEAAKDSISDIYDLEQQLHQYNLDMLDKAQEKFNKQIDTYQQLGDILQHDTKLIQMTLGDKAYDQLEQIYEKQHENNTQQLIFYRTQVDYWKEIRDGYEQGSDEWNNANEKMIDAMNNANQTLETVLQNTAEKFEITINKMFKAYNDGLTKGFGLEYADEEWDLINKNADTYLDTINQIQGINDLERKYLDAINKSSNPAAQQKIQNIMNQQLAILREKDKLTKSDLDMAQKRYDLYLAQIALEEAQQNKSIMRLRRDSQGNYTYQYGVDIEAYDKAKADVDAKRNALYNENKNRAISDIENIQKTNEEMQKKLQDAMKNNDLDMIALLDKQYTQWLGENRTEFAQHLSELDEAIAEEWLAKTGEDFTTASAERQAEIRRQLIPQLEALSKYSVDGLTSETLAQLFEQAREMVNANKETINEDLANGGRTLEELQEGKNQDIEIVTELLDKNQDLLDNYKAQIDATGDFVDSEIKKAEALLKEADAVDTVTEAYTKLMNAQNQEGNEYAQSTGSSTASNTYGQEGMNTHDYDALVEELKVLENQALEEIAKDAYGSAAQAYIDLIKNNNSLISNAITPGQVLRFASGGYTGDWAGTSRLAALDQKELILNATDTANMLNAVTVMRNLAYSLGETTLARLAGVAANNPGFKTDENGIVQDVHIDAQFPNVTNSREIEEAFNDLVNAASQRIFTNR